MASEFNPVTAWTPGTIPKVVSKDCTGKVILPVGLAKQLTLEGKLTYYPLLSEANESGQKAVEFMSRNVAVNVALGTFLEFDTQTKEWTTHVWKDGLTIQLFAMVKGVRKNIGLISTDVSGYKQKTTVNTVAKCMKSGGFRLS